MQEGRPSRTAEYMALFRALEDVRPERARLFSDPLAREFLSPPLRLVVHLARVPGLADLACRFIDRRWPGVRTSAVARTRFIDDRVDRSVARGIRQVVMLGAGFDARAYRLPSLRDCIVFEVDHPDTQARKRRLLDESRLQLPATVRFVPTDFQDGNLEAAMAAAGYDAAARSLFVWEGVTNYLSASAVDATLRWCARSAPGSEIIFTYIHHRVLEDPGSFHGTEHVLQTLAAEGERWTFGIDPALLAGYLQERGLRLVEDVGAADYRALHYGAAAAAMTGYEFYRIARAEV